MLVSRIPVFLQAEWVLLFSSSKTLRCLDFRENKNPPAGYPSNFDVSSRYPWLWESQAIHLKLFHCVFFSYRWKTSPQNQGGVLNAKVFTCFHLRMEEFLGAKHGCRNTVLDDLAETGGYRTGRGLGTIGQRMDTNLVGAEGGANGRSMAFLMLSIFWGFRGGGVGEVAKKSQHIDMFEIKKRGFEIDGFISLSDKWFEADFVFTGTWISSEIEATK